MKSWRTLPRLAVVSSASWRVVGVRIRRCLRGDLLVFSAAGLYIVAALVLLWHRGQLYLWHPATSWMGPEWLQAIGLAFVLVVAFANRRLRRTLTLERIVGGLVVLALVRPLMMTYLAVKQALWPHVVQSGWDATLFTVNRALHGGVLPGVAVIGLLPDQAIHIMDHWYALGWSEATIVTLTAAAWGRHVALRRALILAYLTTWAIGGNLVAWLFASGGPCYLEHLTGNAAYRPLLERLASIHAQTPLAAVSLQSALLHCADTPGACFATGISAMPSIHLAFATITALYWARFGRWAAVAGVLFVVSVQIGSVVLGWHYAIDGYAGILLGLLVWWAVRPVATFRPHSPAFSH